jgi:hypothetical protein
MKYLPHTIGGAIAAFLLFCSGYFALNDDPSIKDVSYKVVGKEKTGSDYFLKLEKDQQLFAKEVAAGVFVLHNAGETITFKEKVGSSLIYNTGKICAIVILIIFLLLLLASS